MNFDLDAVRRATLTHGYERAMRPALFRIGGGDAEAAHHATLQALAGSGLGGAVQGWSFCAGVTVCAGS